MPPSPVFANQAEALEFLTWSRAELLQADYDADHVMSGRDEVLERFGPVFRNAQSALTPELLTEFLSFAKNHHWTGLHRQVSNLLLDFDATRSAVDLLTKRPDESDDVASRFDRTDKAVKGFGEGIMTPILFVAYPDTYGVWNRTSEDSLKLLSLWPMAERGETKGAVYEKVNARLYYARKYLNQNLPKGVHPVDLWTIDYFWHAIKVMHNDGRLTELVRRFRSL